MTEIQDQAPDEPEAAPADSGDSPAESEPTPPPAKRGRGAAKSTATRRGGRPAKRTGAKRTRGTSSRSTSSASAPAGSLAAALRQLVGGIEDEVSAVTRISQQIDEHVDALNGLRADAAARLQHLDELRAEANNANLGAFLDETLQPQFPQVAEDFPERIYGG